MNASLMDRRRLLKLGAGSAAALAVGSAAVAATTPTAQGANWKVLQHDYQAQSNYYYCGPAAVRIALSCRMAAPSQDALAGALGTTTNGTDHIGLVTNVLNAKLGGGWYETKQMPNDPPTQAQKDLLWNDVVYDIDRNYPIVANIVAPPGNQPPGYPADQTIYHYFTAIGYNPDLRQVYIADPANFSGNHHYWLSFDQFASLVPPKGYSA
ncbi:MAG: C39 family peptidase [Propionibacteriales bacterium]|nr:C39 family peptidase [Propionibacteriales bacterium]